MTAPTFLILGSTGGIGRALCERLAERGASLVLGGRDLEKLVGSLFLEPAGRATLRGKAWA